MRLRNELFWFAPIPTRRLRAGGASLERPEGRAAAAEIRRREERLILEAAIGSASD